MQAHKDHMFDHPKGHCDVTKYASDYTALKGYSPYQAHANLPSQPK